MVAMKVIIGIMAGLWECRMGVSALCFADLKTFFIKRLSSAMYACFYVTIQIEVKETHIKVGSPSGFANSQLRIKHRGEIKRQNWRIHYCASQPNAKLMSQQLAAVSLLSGSSWTINLVGGQ